MGEAKVKRADLYEASHRPVATWIPNKDYEFLQKLAESNKVKVSVYLRAIIVDALADEHSSSINKLV